MVSALRSQSASRTRRDAEMQRLAQKRGGKCLSTMYVNNRQPLLWESGRRHRWKVTPANVKGGKRKRGTWCLECYNQRKRKRGG
jgi:hypothetical protein